MSSRRLFTNPLTKLTTSLLVACTLTATASAEIARVPAARRAPTAPGAPPFGEPASTAPVAPPAGAPAPIAPHFAQPPHQMHAPQLDDDLYVAPALTRAAVREALLKARHRNLESFRAYQKAGVFPSNVYQPNQLNVWRDPDGHFCAAATIIRASGMTELVDRVAEQNNFIRLADVTQGPLMDWILTSGFTQDEIAMIQAPFAPVAQPRVEPTQPIVVDARLRAAETARLRAKYTRIDRTLVKNEKKTIELAVDRLMKHPDLAWKIASAE